MLELDPEAIHKYENSPIEEEKQESSAEKNRDEDDDTPQDKTDYKELLQISQEVKKKDQSRKLVLWEKEQMRGQWEQTSASDQKQKGWNLMQKSAWDLNNKTRPEDVAARRKHEMHYVNLGSKVTYLTDYPEQQK